jgi:chromosome partitioning protein
MNSPLVIAVANRKGGVGKTSLVNNLAREIADTGEAVLCVDLDPQATLTLFAGANPSELQMGQTTLAALLPDEIEVMDDLAVPTPWGGADIWRASSDLASAENVLVGAPGNHRRLKLALEQRAQGYSVVLLDCPPSLGHIVMNAFGAADKVLIPVACDYASLHGLDLMLRTLDKFKRFEERPDLEVLGVVGTMKKHTLHSDETIQALRDNLGDLFMRTIIPSSVAVQDAQVAHKALKDFRRDGKASRAYWSLTQEIFERLGSPAVLSKAA